MIRICGVALLMFGLVGCGSGPRLVPVSGTVTHNGKPMEADVLFTPDPGNEAITIGKDTSGPAGNYKIMFGNRSGLAPGKYLVTVTEKLASEPISDEDAEMQAMARASLPEAQRQAPENAPKEAATQTFNVEVKAGEPVYDFDVKSAPKSP